MACLFSLAGALAGGAILVGCGAATGEEGGTDAVSTLGTPDDEVLAEDTPATFCDDGNPCTKDVNCTPCSSLPAAERDIYHCTPDDELPSACAGRTGCFHLALDTPAGQSDDCFPVVGSSPAEAGVCRAGRCTSDPS